MRAQVASHDRELPERGDYTAQLPLSKLRRVALALVLYAAFAFALRPGVARADAPALRWHAPPTCPTERDLLQRIAMRLQGRTYERQGLLAEGSILLSHGRYNLTLQLISEGQRATRALSANSCEALTDTASWLVAVALAPELAAPADDVRGVATEAQAAVKAADLPRAESSGPASSERFSAKSESTPRSSHVESAPRSSHVESDAPQESGQPAQAAPVRPRQRLRTTKLRFVSVRRQKRWIDDGAEEQSNRGAARRSLSASMFAGVFSAGLPAPVSSLGARLGIDFDSVSLQLRGAHMMARTREAGAVRVRFPMQELGAATCVTWGQRVRGGPCATLSLMRTTGFIEGAAKPGRSVVLWGTGGISAYLAWLVQRPFELSAETGLALPISARPRFVLDEFGQLERASSLSLYARLGVGVRFP